MEGLIDQAGLPKAVIRCRKCGRKLTDPVSVRIGLGPVCRGKARGIKWAKHKSLPLKQIRSFEFEGDVICKRVNGEPCVNIPHKLVVHSPDGFEWGYGGSGPADLALNILALFTDEANARRLYQQFKRDFIAKIPREGGVIRREDIIAWLESHEVKTEKEER